MQAFRRSFTFVQPSLARACTVQQPVFTFHSITNDMRDKQKGQEKNYFSKQDAKVLKALVEKMEAQEAEQESEPASKEADLQRIFSDFNLDKEGANSQLWQDLLEWKRHKY